MTFDSKSNLNSIFLKHVSKDEIKKYILGIKESISFYNYGQTNYVLKQILDYIVNPLKFIFNLSITSEVLPHTRLRKPW